MRTGSINVNRKRNGLVLLNAKYTAGETINNHIRNPSNAVNINSPKCLNSSPVSFELATVLASKLATPTGVNLPIVTSEILLQLKNKLLVTKQWL